LDAGAKIQDPVPGAISFWQRELLVWISRSKNLVLSGGLARSPWMGYSNGMARSRNVGISGTLARSLYLALSCRLAGAQIAAPRATGAPCRARWWRVVLFRQSPAAARLARPGPRPPTTEKDD
jgi:hypothetical protein